MNDETDTHGADDIFDDMPTTYDQEMESATDSDSIEEQRNDLHQAT